MKFQKRVALATWNIRLTSSINDISKSLTQRETRSTLQEIVDQAYRMSPSAHSVILFPYKNGHEIERKDGIVSGKTPAEITEHPQKRAVIANFIIKNNTRWIESENEFHTLLRQIGSDSISSSSFWSRQKLKSLAIIRLDYDNNPVGVMFFNYAEAKFFGDGSIKQFINAFTNFATVALINEDYIGRIQKERLEISGEVKKLSDKQRLLTLEATKQKREKEETMKRYNEVQHMLEEILPRAAGASFFLILQGINHDIRTLLLEMQADLDEFKDDLPDKYQDPVKALTRQVENNSMKIANLLKLFNPNEQNKMETCSISEVVEQVLFFFKGGQDTHIKFKTEFSSTLPDLFCHKTEFSMVIYNLVKNAIQAIPKGANGEISISAHLKDKYFNILVQDNGEGIDNDIIDKIFDLRYTTKPAGIGVGLYFVKETLENKLEGRIWVTSQIGKGSKFFIEIPEYINFKNL